MATQFVTSLVRLSYVNVFEPKKTPQGTEKYSVTCLLPKSDTEGFKELMRAIGDEIKANSDGILRGVASPKYPIHDGDGVSPNGTAYGKECEGYWVFTASANAERPPTLVNQKVQPIMSRTELYSGCWAYVAIAIYAYNNQTKGIGFGLNGIQKVKDDENLGYSFDAKKAFTPIEKEDTEQIDLLTGIPF